MRIAHIGNMANDGYHCVKALRSIGLDVELVIDSSDFGMGLPQWEMFNVEADPYKKVNVKDLPPLPDWIKAWDSGHKRNTIYMLTEAFRLARKGEYDLLHLQFPMGNYLQFVGAPFMIYEAGFLRHMINYGEGWAWTKMGIRAYEHAEAVTWTNTDMIDMVKSFKTKKEIFIPFAIDIERYKPIVRKRNDSLELLHPSRQCWDVKGNDRMLKAFVRFIGEGYDARLTLVDWGYAEDVAEAKRLLEPVRNCVRWAAPMNKPRLIEAYQRCDAVLDQFLLGASGTTGFEAMSCGVPLMIFFKPSAATCFGELPPCVNAESEQQILEGMKMLTDETYRKELGVNGRKFVERHLSFPVVANQLKEIYEEVLA